MLIGLSAAAPAAADVLDHAAILAANNLDQPQWYEDNIPFLDTPDENLDEVYYYRWSTYKRALRYTVPGTGYISTEYDVPIEYASDPYTGLVDAAGYHITDGRWLRNQDFAGDYINFWLRGGGTNGQRGFSEWIAAAAYQRYLVTGDATRLKENLPQLYRALQRLELELLHNITVNRHRRHLYSQSPLSDATEYTETSTKTTDGSAAAPATGRRSTRTRLRSTSRSRSVRPTRCAPAATPRPSRSRCPPPRHESRVRALNHDRCSGRQRRRPLWATVPALGLRCER